MKFLFALTIFAIVTSLNGDSTSEKDWNDYKVTFNLTSLLNGTSNCNQEKMPIYVNAVETRETIRKG
jgi:hypothetical protein